MIYFPGSVGCGRTEIGDLTPLSLIDSANSFKDSSLKKVRGCSESSIIEDNESSNLPDS